MCACARAYIHMHVHMHACMCGYLQFVLDAFLHLHIFSKNCLKLQCTCRSDDNGSRFITINHGNHMLDKEMDHLIPANKPQVREQTLVLQQDAKSTSHAGDEISPIVCRQSFLKSLDYWNCSLPKAISGWIFHQIWM